MGASIKNLAKFMRAALAQLGFAAPPHRLPAMFSPLARRLSFALPLLALPLFALAAAARADALSEVDPRIGVLAAGSTVIGPALPNASIHPSPDTPDGAHDGYHPERPIRGFSQLHVSGTGWGQYGNFLVSPQIGLSTVPAEHESPKADEKAEAHQYQVRLTRYDILAELTPSRRSALYRFTFPASEQAHILLNATHHIPGDISTAMIKHLRRPIPAELTLAADGRSLSGHSRFPGGFGGPYTVYFYAEFDQPPASFGTWRDAATQPGATSIKSSGEQEHLGAYARFATTAGQSVQLKIAVSFLSAEKARASLQAEIPGWDFAAVRDAAAQTWLDALAAITVEGGTPAQRTQFNTALYHAQIMPRDRTGEFARFAPDAPMWDDHYAVWDTWRTLYPLHALIRPDVVRDTVASFIERQRVDGTVPDTFIAGVNQFREQGGNGVDQIIADAYVKKIPGIDWPAAYSVLKHNADHRRTGAAFNRKDAPAPYRTLGWIPAEEKDVMSVSFTQEYAQNDFSAALVAAGLGHTDDARRYFTRSQQWENLWNPATESDGFIGFMMPRQADGTWIAFDTKKYPGSWKPYFYEANSWTYSFFAPHQPERLIALMGGPERFITRLQHALANNLLKLDNEPSFLIPQLFHHVGRPDLAAKTLQEITGSKFTLRGYPGDDDSGAMSAYYIWSRLGLFPNAGQDLYYVNGPVFPRTTVRRPGHAPLVITRTGAGLYIASAQLDGQPLTRSWLRHAELLAATRLDFTMSETPTAWGRDQLPPPALPADAIVTR